MLFPLLPDHLALQFAEAARSASIQLLADGAAVEHAACEYTPSGGSRVSKAALRTLRSDLLRAAMTAGYPNVPNQQQTAAFDAEAAVCACAADVACPSGSGKKRPMGVHDVRPAARPCALALQWDRGFHLDGTLCFGSPKCVSAPLVARISPVASAERRQQARATLADARRGRTCSIDGASFACRHRRTAGRNRRRILDRPRPVFRPDAAATHPRGAKEVPACLVFPVIRVDRPCGG